MARIAGDVTSTFTVTEPMYVCTYVCIQYKVCILGQSHLSNTVKPVDPADCPV